MTAEQKPLRVAVMGLRGIPDVMGGIERHCEQLYPNISKDKNLEILIFARAPYVANAGEYSFENIRIIPVQTIKNKYLESILHTFNCILLTARKYRSDVIHIHGIGPALLSPLARLMSPNLVVTHHGADYNREKWNWFAKNSIKFGEYCAAVFSSKVVVVSRSLTGKLKAGYKGQQDKFEYIPNGVTIGSANSTPEEEAALLDRFGLEKGQYILSVGRLVPEKRFEDVILANRKLSRPYKVVIAGGADHADDYSRRVLAEYENDEHVTFTGRLSYVELAMLYRNALTFVLASSHEGLPIAALEALNEGADVILSDIEPNLDIDLDPACYFRTGDADQLAERLSERTRDTSSRNRNFSQEFDWKRIASQLLDIYQGVAKR